MKIITTTYEDFVASEITEHGHDYVEAQFLSGYEPTIVNGIWVWYKHNERVRISNPTGAANCNVSSSTIRSGGDSVSLIRQPQLLG